MTLILTHSGTENRTVTVIHSITFPLYDDFQLNIIVFMVK